ncbi:MAG: hypothetical protein JNN25_16870 [Candidatus Kapabacteria bacterium]|nr:hypothetical protein [Candidatus Kapabacteria bacterium]
MPLQNSVRDGGGLWNDVRRFFFKHIAFNSLDISRTAQTGVSVLRHKIWLLWHRHSCL